MAHGGTNFGFYSGANTGVDESDYKPDLTSYDYDAPIRESGNVGNAKFNALQRVIGLHSAASLPLVPPSIKSAGHGRIRLRQIGYLFDLLDTLSPAGVVESEKPRSMESVGQMFGFLLYVSKYAAKDDGNILSIPKVHDRAQVFISCPSKDNGGRLTHVGSIERWSNNRLRLPNTKCSSNINLFILVENMGRINYGPYLFDKKGILSSVFVNGRILHGWKMISLPFDNLNVLSKIEPIIRVAHSRFIKALWHNISDENSESISKEPAIYAGHFSVENMKQDTFISFSGWGKGVAFVNDFNIGRYWPLVGPQCTLYVPAPILRRGKNVLVLLELESRNPELVVHSVDKPHFTCGPIKSSVHQL
uniref:beta-galactosidase n=2 Tax=Rhizophora mucronata TaxID=61149 RepID=A0A2P2KCJ7_RHIMU